MGDPSGADADSPGRRRSHEERGRAEGPTVDQPLNAEPRPTMTPVLAVLALLVVVGLVFALVTWTRYAT